MMDHLRCVNSEFCTLTENCVYLCKTVNDGWYAVYEVGSNNYRGNFNKSRFLPVNKWRDVYWETKYHNKIKIRNLEDDHLNNIIDMFARWEFFDESESFSLSDNNKGILEVYKPLMIKEYNFRNQDYTTNIAKNYEI